MQSAPLRVVLMVVGAVLLLGLCGCGGGGGTDAAVQPPLSPAPQTLGAASGTVSGAGVNVTQSRLVLDGVQLPVAVGAGGAFEIPGIPPGAHVLDVIGPDGMHAGRVTFTTTAGKTSSVGTISLQPTGQIVGIVTQRDGETLTPLAGVEVVATSDVPVWEEPPAPGLEAADGTAPVVIEPTDPDGTEYHATTDTDGSYVMKGVAPGLYIVTVAVPGLSGGEQIAFVQAGHTAAVDFELEPVIEPGVGTLDCTVYGVYGDGTKAPLEGVLVEAFPEQGWELPISGDVLTVPSGAPLPAGLAAAVRTQEEIEEPPAPPFPGDDGRVVEPPDIIWERFATITDRNGHCSLNVPAGYCWVSAWAWGYEPGDRRVAVRDGSTVTVSFEMKLFEMPQPPLLFDGEEPPGPPL